MADRRSADSIPLPSRSAVVWTLRGRVQGIGARPAIARRAQELGLGGVARNTLAGLVIEVEGAADSIAQLRNELFERRAILPAPGQLAGWDELPGTPLGRMVFEIEEQCEDSTRPLATPVPPDAATCPECRQEYSCDENRRHGYPLITCARCGPRFSLIEQMPFERTETTMRNFALCRACRHEYESPRDRRFHAQTIGCADCGPKIWCSDGETERRDAEAVALAVTGLRQGKIVALRGVGGYQLLCDASSEESVRRLRERKARDRKPFAVLVGSISEARDLGRIDAQEEEALLSAENPIVLVARRTTDRLAPSVAPGVGTVGLLLPTTPLHAELARGVGLPLVCTSANRGGEPLEYLPDQAVERLAGVADLWLHHNRPIARSVDDSVVRVMAGRVVPMRLARGLAPLTLDLPATTPRLAVGGQQKSAIAWHNGSQAALGPHVGDLETLAARERWIAHVAAMRELYRFAPHTIVGDAHPDYFTSQWSHAGQVPVLSVYHHHAHLAAAMLDHQLLDQTVLGVTWDGAGWGPDGMIWGGEFLLANSPTEWRRVAHFRPFPLLGGDLAVREPWRLALAVLEQTLGLEALDWLRRRWPHRPVEPLFAACHRSSRWVWSTSAGRLFDAAAALILGCDTAGFEGEAAMRLEAMADPGERGEYPMPLGTGEDAELDWRPMVAGLVADLQRGESPGTLSARFHRSMVRCIVNIAALWRDVPVAFTGGVFQNRRLVEWGVELFDESKSCGQRLRTPGRIPPNDGGLAAGQLVIASATSLHSS